MTNAKAWFNIALRPRKPEGSLGRTAQDGHLDSHTAPELWTSVRLVTLHLCFQPASRTPHPAFLHAFTRSDRLVEQSSFPLAPTVAARENALDGIKCVVGRRNSSTSTYWPPCWKVLTVAKSDASWHKVNVPKCREVQITARLETLPMCCLFVEVNTPRQELGQGRGLATVYPQKPILKNG